MPTTINLEEEPLTRAKVVAGREHRTLSGVVEDALRQALAQPASVKLRPPIEVPAFESNGLLPGVDLDDSDALVELMDDRDGVARRQGAGVRPSRERGGSEHEKGGLPCSPDPGALDAAQGNMGRLSAVASTRRAARGADRLVIGHGHATASGHATVLTHA